jgi:hypothetical protein
VLGTGMSAGELKADKFPTPRLQSKERVNNPV